MDGWQAIDSSHKKKLSSFVSDKFFFSTTFFLSLLKRQRFQNRLRFQSNIHKGNHKTKIVTLENTNLKSRNQNL